MAQVNVIDSMTNKYQNLTKSGRKVADYIFSHQIDAQYMSITALAEDCGVAEATISRFCRTLGFSGYNEFKLALAKADGASTAEYGPAIGSKVSPDDSVADMCKKLYTADVAAISQTLSQIDEVAVQRAGRYLTEAQHVYCLGQGSSMVIAMEAWARFITVTQQFQCIEDAHMQAMAAALCGPQDVILFFSYSGSTKDMMDVLQMAKDRGACIILVTHFAKSPAAAFADVILLCGSKEGPLQSGSVAAKMGQLFLVDVLFNEYCRRSVERTSQNKDLTIQAIAAKLL